MNIFRGDCFYIRPNASASYDLKEGRPAVIVSNNMGNTYSDFVEVVFLTTKEKKPLPTHAEIICRQKSTALCEQVHTVSKASLGEFIKTCTSAEMQCIDKALMHSLGIAMDQPSEMVVEAPSECANKEIEIERDLYKRLYEQMLDKLTR